MKNFLKPVLASLLVPVAVCSCQKAQEPTGAALFDYFSYEGSDEYYDAHPLQSEDQFYNPILPGFYPDPAIVSNGQGDYYLACSSFTFFPGVPLFHSRDLVNWEQVGHILSRESQLVNMQGQHLSGGIFAPALSYNPKTGTYYMITTNVGAGNFYVKTQDPAGEWSDPIYVPSVQGIDPSIFIDDDGKAYVINNDDAPDFKPEYSGHRTVRIQELDLEKDEMVGERKIIINKGCRPEEKPIWCEAPHIYKVNGYYYLMTAEGGTSTWHSEVIYRSKSVWGPWKPFEGNPILTQRTLDANRPDPITCAGHADLIQTQEGDWWAVFLACRPVENDFENLGREVFILPVNWNEEGWPVICENGKVVERVLQRPGTKRAEDGQFGNFGVRYEFDDDALPLTWLTLRAKGEKVWSLTQNPGQLTLVEDSVTMEDKGTPSLVLHRIQHKKFIAETQMTYVAGDSLDAAGLVLYKDESHSFFLAVTAEGIELRKDSPEGTEVLDCQPLRGADLVLRAESDGMSFSFSYRTPEDKEWTRMNAKLPAAYLSTRDAGGFTGTMLGLYCTGK